VDLKYSSAVSDNIVKTLQFTNFLGHGLYLNYNEEQDKQRRSTFYCNLE
jgi:hypothetical protein